LIFLALQDQSRSSESKSSLVHSCKLFEDQVPQRSTVLPT
jgi:hypothetical protein